MSAQVPVLGGKGGGSGWGGDLSGFICQGDTASTNSLKPATVNTGATVRVPLFINTGDKIRVDTRTREYYERIK